MRSWWTSRAKQDHSPLLQLDISSFVHLSLSTRARDSDRTTGGKPVDGYGMQKRAGVVSAARRPPCSDSPRPSWGSPQSSSSTRQARRRPCLPSISASSSILIKFIVACVRHRIRSRDRAGFRGARHVPLRVPAFGCGNVTALLSLAGVALVTAASGCFGAAVAGSVRKVQCARRSRGTSVRSPPASTSTPRY
jgi:hypothetical protein